MTKPALSEEMYLDQRMIQLKDLASKNDTKIEIVENSNGTAIKFPNGTMICYGSANGTSTLSDYWGQFKRTDENLKLTFPVEFREIPQSVQLTGDSYSSIICTLIKNITTTQLTFFCLKPNSVSSTDYGIKWLAIGKWK